MSRTRAGASSSFLLASSAAYSDNEQVQKCYQFWWKGVAIWYNEHDFLRSMKLWEEAINCLDWGQPFQLQRMGNNSPQQGGGNLLEGPSGVDGPHSSLPESSLLEGKEERNYCCDEQWESLTKVLLLRQNQYHEVPFYPHPTRQSGTSSTIVKPPDDTSRGFSSYSPLSYAFVAPLLLFLAGCHLDAGKFQLARLCLAKAVAVVVTNNSSTTTSNLQSFQNNTITNDRTHTSTSNLMERIMNECVASLEEDKSLIQPWEYAQKMVSFAIQFGYYPQWRDPFQRPGFLWQSSSSDSSSSSRLESSQHDNNNQRHHSSKAWYDRSEHPSWCTIVEANFALIRDELQKLLQVSSKNSNASSSYHPTNVDGTQSWPIVGSGLHRDGAGQHDGTVIDTGDWRELVLFGSGARPDLAPATSQLLRQYCSEAITLAEMGGGEIILSALSPHTHIRPHCGSTNVRLTAHLGLIIPSSNCGIRVASTWYEWEEGKVIVFDDSFEHEVKNDSNTIRVVLLIRFWNPILNPTDRELAIQNAQQAKQDDCLRRCNPPLPIPNVTVSDRGFKRSRCKSCWNEGFESIRMEWTSHTFHCVCGELIQ